MKKKFVFAIVGVFIFVVCFVASVRIHDCFYEQKLRQNIHKVKVGMSDKDVIEILGSPTHIQMADGPYYWCYDTDSISQTFEDDYYSQIHCGHMLLEMWYSMDGKKASVGRVFDFDH